MTYNERYQVKRLSPEDRRRDAEIAVRKKLVGAKKRHQADDIEDDEDWEEYTGPLAAVTKRYDLTPDYGEYYHQTPLRRSAPVTQAAVAAPTPRFKIHWFVYVGLALMFMLMGYIVLANLGAWWQQHQDDSTYGMPRTYQTDAVVGHSDSSSNPSHFIAENLQGHIIVVEFPGGDLSKARDYSITSEAGGDASVPVKLSFQDINGDGKLDMIVQVGDPGNIVTFTFYNDGTQFTSKP